jgi:DNA primase
MLLDGEGTALSTSIETAPGLVASMAEEVALRGDHREAKERALHHLQESLHHISDPIRRELMAQEAADVFGIRSSLLLDQAEEKPTRSESSTPGTPHMPTVEGSWFDTEYAVLKFAMAARAARRRLFELLTPEDLEDPRLQEIFRALHARDAEFGESADARMQGSFQNDETESMAARLLADQPSEGLDALAELEAALQRRDKLLERAQRESRREQLHRKYAAGEDWRGEIPQDETDDAHESL